MNFKTLDDNRPLASAFSKIRSCFVGQCYLVALFVIIVMMMPSSMLLLQLIGAVLSMGLMVLGIVGMFQSSRCFEPGTVPARAFRWMGIMPAAVLGLNLLSILLSYLLPPSDFASGPIEAAEQLQWLSQVELSVVDYISIVQMLVWWGMILVNYSMTKRLVKSTNIGGMRPVYIGSLLMSIAIALLMGGCIMALGGSMYGGIPMMIGLGGFLGGSITWIIGWCKALTFVCTNEVYYE